MKSSLLMDDVDGSILKELIKDGRISMAELGQKVNLAPSTVFKRIEKLKQNGIIERATIVVNPAYYEKFQIAYLGVGADHENKRQIETFISRNPLVLEAYETLEPEDYIIKVRITSISQLKDEIIIPLGMIEGVREIKPMIAVKSLKQVHYIAEEI